MREGLLVALAFGLLAALAGGQFATAGKTPVDVGEPKPGADEPKAKADEPGPGKGKRAKEFIAAFNKGAAKAVAAYHGVGGVIAPAAAGRSLMCRQDTPGARRSMSTKRPQETRAR
jgi:hypothetical protein